MYSYVCKYIKLYKYGHLHHKLPLALFLCDAFFVSKTEKEGTKASRALLLCRFALVSDERSGRIKVALQQRSTFRDVSRLRFLRLNQNYTKRKRTGDKIGHLKKSNPGIKGDEKPTMINTLCLLNMSKQ